MQIQVNTDHNTSGSVELQEHVEQVVQSTLGRFEERITRVEVHLNDVNGQKSGENDQHCVMEARLGGMKPLTATDNAATLDQALHGAAGKLKRLVESTLGKLTDKERSEVNQ